MMERIIQRQDEEDSKMQNTGYNDVMKPQAFQGVQICHNCGIRQDQIYFGTKNSGGYDIAYGYDNEHFSTHL